MSADAFIDTNVFIYQLDGADPAKQAIAEGIVRSALLNGTACTSVQVAQECMNTVLRKAQVKLSPAQAASYLEVVLAPLVQVSGTVAQTLPRTAPRKRARGSVRPSSQRTQTWVSSTIMPRRSNRHQAVWAPSSRP
jgi:predicted nucleic acid-binding protein